MATRSTQKFHLIWLTYDIDELKKNFSQSFTSLQNIASSMDTFSNTDAFLNYIFEANHEKVLMIVSGVLGEETVPIIHDASQLDSIYVFCHNKTRHEQWAKNWPKVKGVFNKIDKMCRAVEQAIQQRELIQPKPATVSLEPPPVVRRSLTPEPPGRTTHRDRAPAVDDQRHEASHGHPQRRARSYLPDQTEVDTKPTSLSHAEPTRIERETPAASLRGEMDVEKRPTPQPLKHGKATFVETATVVDNQHETSRLRDGQTASPVPSFKESVKSSSPQISSTPPSVRKTPNSQQPLPSSLEHTLTNVIEREIRQSIDRNNDMRGSTPLDIGTVDRLQDTIRQTITKHVTSKTDDSNELKILFADLKQALLGAVVQQPTQLQDLIKQIVADALSEQQKSALGPTTTPGLTHHRKPITIATSREVKITANLKLTRIDAAFRQQRDAVVANKRLREVVQQWSSVVSMADLAILINSQGANSLECAWLLFCWVCQNIQYKPYCSNNAAESVFRKRQGVCRGFVSLYHECCSLLGIECFEISGYAKQAFLKPGEELKQSPHAWNSIVLDEHTYLVESTWGAGGRDTGKQLEDFYFLTPPEELIYTHYCNEYQLLDPEITKEEFLSLPVMKSTYYQLGLTLLSPKQGLNATSENLFKIAIRAPGHVDLFIDIKVGDIKYPRSLHTLCQRDETQSDVYNCYVAPPADGLYEIGIYAKTNKETSYLDAINMRLRVSNLVGGFTFPLTYATFTEHNCILIEPLHRLVHKNEQILIHMKIPNANVIKIHNGDDNIVPGKDEYKKGILKKIVRVQGDLQVCARWDDNADTISIICVFNML